MGISVVSTSGGVGGPVSASTDSLTLNWVARLVVAKARPGEGAQYWEGNQVRGIKVVLGAMAAAGLLTVSVGGPVQAEKATYKPPKVAWAGHVHAKGGGAPVFAKFRCFGGNEGTHLLVSLKEGGGIK